MKSINEVIISITNRCNLQCKMCDIPQEQLEELDTEQWKQVIRDAFLKGAHTIVFSGGEPLLRNDIFALIDHSRKLGMNACLTSNGILVDDDCAVKLKQSGVNVVNISVEGKAETHDLLRGSGAYAKAINALKALNAHGIETTVAATISKYNFQDLELIIQTSAELKATTVRFQPFNRLFLKDKTRADGFFIEQKDKGLLSEQINRVIESAKKYNISINPYAYLKMVPEYLCSKAAAASKGCESLWSSCPINARGDVFPCWVLASDEKLVGNLRTERFSRVWDSEKHDLIRQKIVADGCKGCLMSCYDKVYAKKPGPEELLQKAKKITRKNTWQRQFKKAAQKMRAGKAFLSDKYRFYKAYNGSLSKVLTRWINSAKRKLALGQSRSGHDIDRIKTDIQKVKKKLKEERALLK